MHFPRWTRPLAAAALAALPSLLIAQDFVLKRDSPATSQTVSPWVSVGPAPVTSASGPLAGRVTSTAPDPADSTGNTLLLGTAGGGVWRAVNAASASPGFTPLTDAVAAFGDGSATPSLAIGAVTVQPGNTGVYLAGTGEPGVATGAHYGEGLLRSIDGGETWSVIQGTTIGTGGRQVFTGEAFAAFAWSSAAPATVVAAVTGSGDGAQTGIVTLGASVRGLYYSEDSGATWQLATIQDIAGDGSTQIVESGETNFSSYDGNSAVSVVWNPQRKMFFAAVSGHGIYSSPDGSVFTRLSSQPVALSACPTDPGFIASAYCPFQSAALGVEPTSADMYAWFADAAGSDRGIYLDRCAAKAGSCGAAASFATQLEPGSGTALEMQHGMALLAVASGAATNLLAGAGQLYGCTVAPGANSCSFNNLSATCATAVAGQWRALAAAPSGQVFGGTSDGLWRAPDPACSSPFVNLNAGLGSIAPLVSVAGTSQLAGTVLAGSEQLGTVGTASAPALPWPQLASGDGGAVALDTAHGSAYADTQAGINIERCTGGAACGPGTFTPVIGPAQVGGDAALEHPPILLDRANPQLLLTGTCRVWRGNADGSGWPQSAALSGPLDGNSNANCATDALISALAVGGPQAKTSSGALASNVIYAGMSGLETGSGPIAQSSAGAVFVNSSAAHGGPWQNIANSPVSNAGLGNAVFNQDQYDVSAVVADAHDATGATVYATIRGFGVPLVYLSTSFGASWTNITSNLPDSPANALAVDPNDANTVYIALDQGVFATRDVTTCAAQDCWQVYGTGLPAAQVMALDTAGGAVGLLRAATRGRGAWQTALATGSTSADTTAVASPASLDFGGIEVSTSSAQQTVTVTNTGSLPLVVTRVAITGDFSETDSCARTTLQPGKTCAAQITFSPSTTGSRTGTLFFYANVSGGQIGPVALAGTGLSAPSIQLSPSGTLDFGLVTIGASSAVEYVLVANTGQSAATLDSFTAGGDFHVQQNTCGASLPAQTGCSIGIVFTPTARGDRTGTFTVTDSAGTQTLSLAGTGQSPADISLSPQSLTFGATNIGQQSAVQTITVTNAGDVPASITGVLATGDFHAASSCGTSLAGSSSCSISITFAPTQSGTRTGLLTVTTPFQTRTASLTGTGVGVAALTLSPPSLSFGDADIGQTVGPLVMTLKNTGSAPDTIIAVTTATSTSGTHDYAATSNCATLAAGASCTISVRFTPSVAGSDPGTLTIQASVAGTSVTASLSGSGNMLAFANGSTPPGVSVPSGQVATYALWLNDDGATGTVTFACSGLPAGASCTPPAPFTMPGSGILSVTLKVATGKAPRGTYSFSLTASNGGSTTRQPLNLTVQ